MLMQYYGADIFAKSKIKEKHVLSELSIQYDINNKKQREFFTWCVAGTKKENVLAGHGHLLRLPLESKIPDEIDEETICVQLTHDKLFVYWSNNGKIMGKPFEKTDKDIEDICNSLSLLKEDNSKDKELIKKITSKYNLTLLPKEPSQYQIDIYKLLQDIHNQDNKKLNQIEKEKQKKSFSLYRFIMQLAGKKACDDDEKEIIYQQFFLIQALVLYLFYANHEQDDNHFYDAWNNMEDCRFIKIKKYTLSYSVRDCR